jgi:outer membrane protein assembly factor BamB
MRLFVSIVMLVLLSTTMKAIADDVVTVRWDKGKGDQRVAAIDLARRVVLWEATPCRAPNITEKTSVGLLVTCDDSNVALLDPATGNVLWRRDLAMIEPDEYKRQQRTYREIKLNRFHSEKANGFFLSKDDETYVLIGKKGEYLMRCDRQGCNSSPKADREMSKP